jgi:hypothetical protein
MITIINLILAYSVIAFLLYERYNIKDVRYENFVKSIKAKDLQEFTETIEEESNEIPAEDEVLTDLTEVPSNILIKALKKEHEDKQSKN